MRRQCVTHDGYNTRCSRVRKRHGSIICRIHGQFVLAAAQEFQDSRDAIALGEFFAGIPSPGAITGDRSLSSRLILGVKMYVVARNDDITTNQEATADANAK